ncbi:MAG: SCO family protein [Steroidobacteraceae bacterium]
MTTSKAAARKALVKMALVMLLGLGAGVALFIATLRSTPEKTVAPNALADLSGLIDTQAMPFDANVLQGRYTLAYFGFTFCPDACPTALYNLTLALRQLDENASRIQAVFVSVDPARDSPEKMADYLGHFSANFIGLTGSAEDIQAVERRFGVIAIEHRDETLPGGYTMDHSNEFLLFSPGGKLLMRLPADQSVDVLLEQLRGLTRTESV